MMLMVINYFVIIRFTDKKIFNVATPKTPHRMIDGMHPEQAERRRGKTPPLTFLYY